MKLNTKTIVGALLLWSFVAAQPAFSQSKQAAVSSDGAGLEACLGRSARVRRAGAGAKARTATSPDRPRGDERYDYGAIKLNCTVGNMVGWYGITTANPKNKPSIIQGYPGDKPLEQWFSADKVRATTSRQVFYNNDTIGGMSGSPVGDVLRSLSKKKMYGSPNSNPSPELGADKENHTSWERYYQVSDCSSSLRNDWYSGI